jgi:glycosyltransferase involved in cell wall biosynthesis
LRRPTRLDRLTEGIVRVLIAHSWYQDDVPSGENRVVEEDIRELTAAGIEVSCSRPEAYGPSLGGMPSSQKTSLGALARNGRRLLDQVRPDIVHVHHPYPEYLMTVRAMRHRDVPLVHTVHNMRHVCPAGSAVRDGRSCTVCADERVPVSCAVHRCVSGSLAKSATLPLMVRWIGPEIDRADVRIAPSEFVKGRLLATDPDEDGRIVVLPHAVPDPWVDAADVEVPSEPFVIFAGRLTEEKGARLLVEALDGLGSDLPFVVTMAGDGALRDWVRERAAASGGRLRWLGQLTSADLRSHMRHAAAVVVPSVGVESFGLVAAEALGSGTPVLATDRGALPEVVGECGSIVEATAAGLRRGLAELAEPTDTERYAARERWRDHFSPAVRSDRLVAIYRAAIKRGVRER